MDFFDNRKKTPMALTKNKQRKMRSIKKVPNANIYSYSNPKSVTVIQYENTVTQNRPIVIYFLWI
jgi:hypothetical protein